MSSEIVVIGLTITNITNKQSEKFGHQMQGHRGTYVLARIYQQNVWRQLNNCRITNKHLIYVNNKEINDCLSTASAAKEKGKHWTTAFSWQLMLMLHIQKKNCVQIIFIVTVIILTIFISNYVRNEITREKVNAYTANNTRPAACQTYTSRSAQKRGDRGSQGTPNTVHLAARRQTTRIIACPFVSFYVRSALPFQCVFVCVSNGLIVGGQMPK